MRSGRCGALNVISAYETEVDYPTREENTRCQVALKISMETKHQAVNGAVLRHTCLESNHFFLNL